jgi:integrase/recombinase XerC
MASLFKKDNFFIQYINSDGKKVKESLNTSNASDAECIRKKYEKTFGQVEVVQLSNKDIWYIKYKDHSNNWRMRSCMTTKKSEAEIIRKKYDAEEFNRIHKAPVRIADYSTIEAFEKFRDFELIKSCTGKDKQPTSIRREKRALDNFIDFLKLTHITKLTDLNKMIVEKFFTERSANRISPRTRREERRVIRKFFVWAIQNHLVVENPTDTIPTPQSEPKKPRYFREKELEKIFNASKPPYTDIFKFLYLTGLRIGELSNLEWSDFLEDTDELTIRVIEARRRKDNKGIRIEGNKTKREECIPLNADAIEIIKRRKKENQGKNQYVFVNGHGTKLDNDNIYRNLERVLDACNIKDGSPHVFRHTFASHLVIKGVSLYVVRDLLRHKSIIETEIYAHLSNETKKNAACLLKLDALKSEIEPDKTE